MRVLVTGASGFVGSPLCRHLFQSGIKVRAVVRNRSIPAVEWETFVLGDINESTDWRQALAGVDMVIHAAARVHVMRDRSEDPLAEFRRVNTAGTEHLARQAAKLGVQRVVYVSSIKVNGENTEPSAPFRETDSPNPQDPYGVSKLEAEVALKSVAAATGLEVVIVRPPLIYGPNVRGNVATMLSLAYRGIPLPLASIANSRSFLAVENLCSFLHRCLTSPAAAGETFLVSDGRALSTPELFRLLSAGMGRRARLYSIPDSLLKTVCSFGRLQNIYRRLCQSLVVDARKATELLGWQAPVAMERALERTGHWYLGSKQQFGGGR